MLLALAFAASFSLSCCFVVQLLSLSCCFVVQRLFSLANDIRSFASSLLLLLPYSFSLDSFDDMIIFSRFIRRYDNADVAFTMQFIAISLADSNDLPRFLAVSYNSDVAFTMQFIAISRADSNDLPRFLAVSLISFISLVEMSQCNNMPILVT